MILRGWKEICAYLKMSVRTVKKLRKDTDIPISNLNCRPIAITEDLENWIRQKSCQDKKGVQNVGFSVQNVGKSD